jgi:transcriptional regulator with XRE-family HTH domain
VADDAGAGRGTRRDRLAARRRTLGLTQEDLAARLGVERSTVVRWECGATQPLPWIRPRLAKALQVPAGQLAKLLDGDGAAASPGRPGPLAPVPRQLPPIVAGLTGRASELAALTGFLDEARADTPGTVVISAIGGTAGVGKTALALHWAHQVAHRFGGGQLYVNLRGFDPSGTPVTPAQAIRKLLDALGLPPARIPPQPDAQAALYRSLLSDKRMLVALDNARDEQQVRPLLPASPASLVLVTSRNQLAGLVTDGARLLSLDVLTPGEAVQLLTARLGTGRAAAEPNAVNEIARLCAGLPLALAVAAARALPGPTSRWPPWPPSCATPPDGWTPSMPGTRQPACGRSSPGPTGSSGPTQRGCSGCSACTPAPTSPPRPPPASLEQANPRPAGCWASWPEPI